METNEISHHLARIYSAVKTDLGWLTANDIAVRSSVSPRTARAHCLNLVKNGVFDQAEVFPAHRYRFSKMAGKRNRTIVQRIEEACVIFGIKF